VKPRKPVTVWRYTLPPLKHEGWGFFILDSKGYFSAITDYGNYAHLWTYHGRDDFREFVIDVGGDYVYRKLRVQPEQYNGERTAKAIRTVIEECALLGSDEEDLFLEYKDEICDSEFGFGLWYRETTIGDACDLVRRDPDCSLVGFIEKLLPRLQKVIKKHMAGEPVDEREALVEEAVLEVVCGKEEEDRADVL
jgi:hypothetical protein